MTTLDEAWDRYQYTRQLVGLTGRIASRYWNQLPWDGPLGRDDQLKELDHHSLTDRAASSLAYLDDLAVLVLFSMFESEIRELMLAQVHPEAEKLTHPALISAAKVAIENIRSGSFYRILEPFKSPETINLIEHVNQVRRYRNWVAHGKREKAPANVSPQDAYDRLKRLLELLSRPS
ncbi:MAG TPA: hypothetical protein VGZ22_26690 [Isosphaeraceae bacterium]|jgi:hypothetical protein|nr:hypothetical protein [Isosphaeraceae bacterium]